MPKPRKSAEEVCIEYAIAREQVREQTRIMQNNRCEFECEGEFGPSGYREGREETCLSEHWTNELTHSGSEEPAREYEDMCDACKVRHKAVQDRKAARQRFGATKRSVEAVGKRLQKEGAL